jgi:threonine aldolase
MEEVESNILFAEIPAELMDADLFVARLREEGVIVNPPKSRRIRLITHHDVSADDVEFAGRVVREVLSKG